MPTRKKNQNENRFSINFQKDQVTIIETNLDDVSGEILEGVIEKMLSLGALDATITPFLGKKGRPGQTLRVVCKKQHVPMLANLIITETGTMGVKLTNYTRLVVPRKIVAVEVKSGKTARKIRVKESLAGNGRILRIKPEASEVKQFAKIADISIFEANGLAIEAARRKIQV